MNESQYLRQQLALERSHLQEILQVVRRGSAAMGTSRPVAEYIDWAGRRLLSQLHAHRQALQAAAATDAVTGALLDRLAGAASRVSDGHDRPSDVRAEHLLALIAAWSEPLDVLARSTLHVSQWRQAAQLNADTILQERQLYAKARAAARRA
jgi:hypothetical protein